MSLSSHGPISARRRRRGSAYLVVLGATLIVSSLAFTGLLVSASQRRSASSSIEAAEARQIARDAIEIAQLWIHQDPNWRVNRPAGAWATNVPLGPSGGTFSLEATDVRDGDMQNRPHDEVVLTATGKKGSASHTLQVTLEAKPVPIPALSYSLHTGGELHVLAGKTLTATGSTVSTNGTITNQGLINANVSCTLVGIALPLGVINGTTTLLAPARAFPDSTVIDKYVGLGTQINTSIIDTGILAPGLSSYGATNPDGIYVVRPTGDFTIKNCRLYGTLVVICQPGKKVIVDNAVLLEPATPDQPSLIIQGNAEFNFDGVNKFKEKDLGLNFNPVEAPVDGDSNTRTNDLFYSEVRGVVHVKGKVVLKQTSRIRGALICESNASSDAVRVEDSPSIVYTPSLLTAPPMWYTTSVPMAIKRGTWQQVAN